MTLTQFTSGPIVNKNLQINNALQILINLIFLHAIQLLIMLVIVSFLLGLMLILNVNYGGIINKFTKLRMIYQLLMLCVFKIVVSMQLQMIFITTIIINLSGLIVNEREEE